MLIDAFSLIVVQNKGHSIEKYMSLLFEEIPLSAKLELYRANQDQIRNQRPLLRRKRIFLGRKAGGGEKVKKYKNFY